MKKNIISSLVLLITIQIVNAQSTAELVYNIFQTSCSSSSCHSNSTKIAGLDLEGEGPNKLMQVYNDIVGVNPQNNHANEKGYKLIKPGDVGNSFLYRKINNELESTINLHPDELANMPRNLDPLQDEDIELVRQWILHGAPLSGSVIDPQLIDDFYNNNGIESVSNPPLAPEEGEGFQLHLGPFFLPAGVEREVYLKHEITLPEDIEIRKIETEMGGQSHHFIMYRYYYEDEEVGTIPISGPSPESVEEGFRIEGAHLSGNIVSASQNSDEFEFPNGTAIFWRDTSVLDLNSHYINSTSSVLSCDVYVNIYTQPKGTALHEMKSGFIPYFNSDFNIPNDGQDYTFTGKVPFAPLTNSSIYMWGVSSHTHQWGQDYDIYKLNSNFTRGEHIYDASCLDDGVPGCVTEFYDYQHPPMRIFEDYYEIKSNEGLEHEAVFNNTGPRPNVGWGNFTSEDEMMLFIFYYLESIEGLAELNTTQIDTVYLSTDFGTDVEVCISDLIDYAGASVSGSFCKEGNNSSISFLGDNFECVTISPDLGFVGSDTLCVISCDGSNEMICDTTFIIVEVKDLGTNVSLANSSNYLRLQPNPFRNYLQVIFNNGKETRLSSLVLNDVTGRQLLVKDIDLNETSEVLIETSDLKSGIYILNVYNAAGQLYATRKLIKD